MIAAHRYEAEHPKPVATDNLSYRDVQMRPDFVYEHWDVVSSLATTILQFQLENKETNDSTAAIAIEALAETFRTLGTGIYYERPPDFPLGRALYVKLGEFIQQYRKEKAARAGFGTLSDSAIFHLLVFLLRVARQETNGRPRSRAFLGFLQARFPLSATPDKEPSRIIVP